MQSSPARFAFAVLLLLCITFCFSSVHADTVGDFDYYVLSVQWPSTSCQTLRMNAMVDLAQEEESSVATAALGKKDNKGGKDHHDDSHATHGGCVPQAVNGFTIHGLWPQKGKTMGPQNCGGQQFNMKQLMGDSELAAKMHAKWADLKSTNDDGASFYEHEWSKHGTCSGFKQNEYFSNTIQALERMPDLVKVLHDAGIDPRPTPHPMSAINHAFETAFGKAVPYMACSRRGDLFGELRFCLDKKSLTPIPCGPGHDSTGCESEVKLLPLDSYRRK